MRFVADSSLLVRLYLHDSKSESVERFLADGAKVVSLSGLARVEVLNVLLRHQDRADRFLADLDEGLRLRLEPVDWPRAFQQAESLADGAKVVSLSGLARVEVLNVLLRHQDRADQFLADLDEGLRLRLEPVDWPRAFQQAESLARRFSSTLRPGGHDLVLVAAAVTMGGAWFLSFDRNSRQRPLAAAAGLRVWPPLEKDEKGLVRHASRKGIG